MKPQHTPGPWEFFNVPPGCGVMNRDSDIAHCSGFNSSRSRSEELANARLIAAAPELLDMARDTRDYLSGIPESAAGGDDAAMDLVRRLDALLARIGGAP